VGRSQNRSHPNGLRPHGSHLIDGLAPEAQAGVGAAAQIKRNLQVANVLGSVLTKALIGWRTEATESQTQPRGPPSPLTERSEPRDGLAEDQRVDLVRPLVGVDGFEVVHVADHWVLGGDAVGAEH